MSKASETSITITDLCDPRDRAAYGTSEHFCPRQDGASLPNYVSRPRRLAIYRFLWLRKATRGRGIYCALC